ncbi:MAG: NAD-dependent malic enzyme, partial [Elusimicrobia bacterium]|nr:NAD-dependent malic enzyme [Elusimicrobiota bacterium]
MKTSSSSSYSVTVRLKMDGSPGAFHHILSIIRKWGGTLGSVDHVASENGFKIRDVIILSSDQKHSENVIRKINKIKGVRVVNVSDRTFLMHLGGKIEVIPRVSVKTRDDLSMIYTPGVGRVSMALAKDPSQAWNLTIKKNTVAIVSDGTSVLGLGDIGPIAALPVMEGKAVLFKAFAGVDAFPLCLDTKDTQEIIETVCRIAPVFGAINLEDISAP